MSGETQTWKTVLKTVKAGMLKTKCWWQMSSLESSSAGFWARKVKLVMVERKETSQMKRIRMPARRTVHRCT